jgi:hypothetical protein
VQKPDDNHSPDELDERLGGAKASLQALSSSISDILQHRTLAERMTRNEKYLNVISSAIAGPMMTPQMVRKVVRQELIAFSAETQHNQAAYHATVNVAYVRSRELLCILKLFEEVLLVHGIALAPELKERLRSIEADYQRELNKAIRDALDVEELLRMPSNDEVKARLL